MSETHVHQVPALPIVAPLTAAVFALLIWRLHRQRSLDLPRAVVAAAACTVGAGIVANSFFPFYLGRNDVGVPWRVFLNLSPLVDTEAFDMAQNVLIFIPIGFFLPLVTRVESARRALLLGFLLSLTVETLQFLNAITGHGGHIADINDLLANTLGTPIGFAIFQVALRWPFARRLADAAAWPGTERSGGHTA